MSLKIGFLFGKFIENLIKSYICTVDREKTEPSARLVRQHEPWLSFPAWAKQESDSSHTENKKAECWEK